LLPANLPAKNCRHRCKKGEKIVLCKRKIFVDDGSNPSLRIKGKSNGRHLGSQKLWDEMRTSGGEGENAAARRINANCASAVNYSKQEMEQSYEI